MDVLPPSGSREILDLDVAPNYCRSNETRKWTNSLTWVSKCLRMRKRGPGGQQHPKHTLNYLRHLSWSIQPLFVLESVHVRAPECVHVCVRISEWVIQEHRSPLRSVTFKVHYSNVNIDDELWSVFHLSSNIFSTWWKWHALSGGILSHWTSFRSFFLPSKRPTGQLLSIRSTCRLQIQNHRSIQVRLVHMLSSARTWRLSGLRCCGRWSEGSFVNINVNFNVSLF